MAIRIEPLEAPLGALVHGLDSSKPLSDEDFATVEQAMYDHVAIPPLKSWCAEDRPDCRQPVEGTVPVTGGDPVVPPAQLAPTATNIRDLGRRFQNPVLQTAESLGNFDAVQTRR